MAAENSLEEIMTTFINQNKESKVRRTFEHYDDDIQVQLTYYPGRNTTSSFNKYCRIGDLKDENVLIITHIYIEKSADRSTEKPEERKNLVEKAVVNVLGTVDIDAIVIECITNEKWFEHLTGPKSIQRWSSVSNSVYVKKGKRGGRKSITRRSSVYVKKGKRGRKSNRRYYS